MLWNILPPPPEAPPDRVYQHPHYSQQYLPSHQEQQQHLLHKHNNNPLPSLPPYTTYTQQRQRQPYPQHPDHTPYHTREHSHGHGYPPAPYPHNAVATPIPSAQSHCTTPAYGQKQPHLTMEERPRHSLPLSFPNDTSHHLYQQQQQQQQSMQHYRYPTTLSSAPPSAADNVSLPSWSARAPETGSMYGGTSIRPSPEATFPSHQLREADEPPFSHEYISDTSRRLSHPYAQLPEPYPFYHDHSHENPSTRTHEQNHPQRNVPFDNHFTAHAHQKPVLHHQYQHPYVPSSALRPRPPSPSRMAPSVPLYDTPKWHESTDFCPRKDDIMGNRKFVKSNDFPPLPSFAKLTNSKHTPSLPLKRKSEVEYQSSGQHEIANRYRSPPSCGRDLHRSSHTEDATRPPKPTRYPSPTTTSLNSAESLTELANASLIPKHISKSATEESAYPSPSSSIFSDKSNGLVLQGLRRDRYTPPNHSCFSCGGSDVDAVGDGWTDGGTIPCNECGKTYQHKRNIVTQQWKETSRYPLSQKEKMQIMDAASILFTLKSVQANSTVVTSSSSSSFAASDINSRASTPGTITQPNSPQLSPDTLPTPSEEISPLSIRSLLLVSPDAGSSVTEITESETKTKTKTAKGRKEKKRKVSD